MSTYLLFIVHYLQMGALFMLRSPIVWHGRSEAHTRTRKHWWILHCQYSQTQVILMFSLFCSGWILQWEGIWLLIKFILLHPPLWSHPYENMNDFFVFTDMTVLLLISVVKIGSLTFYQLCKIPPFYNLVRKFVCRWLLFSFICLWKTEWKKYFRMACSRLCSSISSFCLCRGRKWHPCFTSLYVPHWVGLSKEACLLIMPSYMETATWWWLCILLAHWL